MSGRRRRREAGGEGQIAWLGTRGEGAIESAQGPVYVPRTAPGDRVRYGLIERRGGIRRAPLLEVLDAGPTRRPAPCPRASRCGGCGLMHLSEDAQHAFKRMRVGRALSVFGDAKPELVAGDTLAYRARARLAWRAGVVGYRAPRRHQLIGAPECAVLVPALDAVLPQLTALALQGEGEVHLALRDGVPVVQLRSERPQPPAAYRALEAAVEEGRFAGAELRVAGARATFGQAEERRPGPDGVPLVAPLGAFAQAHAALEGELARAVVAAAAPAGQRVLEVYAGHGLLTVGLARDAARLRAVERDADAVAACRENLAARGLGADVRALDAAEAFTGAFRPQVLVLDPPRAGLAEARSSIVAARVPRVIYVSCEPSTLAGDLRAFAAAGYALESATAYDLFPQTPHVEALVVLEHTGRDC